MSGRRKIIIALACFFAFIIIVIAVTACIGYFFVRKNVDFEFDRALFESARIDKSIEIYYYPDSTGEKTSSSFLFEEVDYSDEKRIWYSYEEIPKVLKDGFIAVEDRKFFNHNGVDVKRTLKAAYNLIFKGEKDFGGSTITQQVIKNLSGDNEKTVKRKLVEIIRAGWLESVYSKEEIFEIYLNIIPMSNNGYGIGYASRAFFGKEPMELNSSEVATIIAITNAPTRYNPYKNPVDCKSKRDTVLDIMYSEGVIDEAEYRKHLGTELNVKAYREGEVFKCSDFSGSVISEAIEDVAKKYECSIEAARLYLFSKRAKIYSTVDPEIQGLLEEYFNNPDNFPSECLSGLEFSMVVFDSKNGELKALKGSVNSSIDHSDIPRAPGSALKPLALYLPLVNDKRITWSTMLEDTPSRTETDENGNVRAYPKNYPEKYDGNISIADALRLSKNTVAVRLYDILGAERIYKYLRDEFGFDTLVYSERKGDRYISDLAPSPLALGQLSYGVTLKKLTNAYTVFPRDGIVGGGKGYTEVTDQEGNSIVVATKTERRVCSPEAARVMTGMLINVVESGTASSISLKNVLSVAGKTGTSGNDLDRLFIGYTPYYTAGIWCGYTDKGTPVGFHSKNHLSIWDDIMKEIHSMKVKGEPKDFNFNGLIIRPYCKLSGKVFTERCITEGEERGFNYGYYIKGTEPIELCDEHGIQTEPKNNIKTKRKRFKFFW